MPSLKEIAGKTGNKNTKKNKVINHISLLFIRQEKKPRYMIINRIDWDYLTSLSGIREYLDTDSIEKHEHSQDGLVGFLWKTPVLLIEEATEVKVYHEGNFSDMKKDFPNNLLLQKVRWE